VISKFEHQIVVFNKHPMAVFETAGRNLSGYLIALLKATVGQHIRFITPESKMESRGCQVRRVFSEGIRNEDFPEN
jgi:hypothetical protein